MIFKSAPNASALRRRARKKTDEFGKLEDLENAPHSMQPYSRLHRADIRNISDLFNKNARLEKHRQATYVSVLTIYVPTLETF